MYFCRCKSVGTHKKTTLKRYFQGAAYRLPTEEKEAQEKRSLLNTNDNFRKIIIVSEDIKRKIDDQGIVTMSLYDFLLDSSSI